MTILDGKKVKFEMLDNLIMKVLVHLVVIINTYFLLKGEKYYNENVGAE